MKMTMPEQNTAEATTQTAAAAKPKISAHGVSKFGTHFGASDETIEPGPEVVDAMDEQAEMDSDIPSPGVPWNPSAIRQGSGKHREERFL